ALPSRTANRCKTIDRFSRYSPLEIDRRQIAHTPLLTLALERLAQPFQGVVAWCTAPMDWRSQVGGKTVLK
ncbi:hypothetical protein, partial [Burkholderia stabilis]|uniref:hypothetical protein n=1 Tax=Burkholderia stabilis TaxID=95485 RepID=UPI001ABA6619